MPVLRNQIPSSPAMKQGIVAVLGPESICNKPASIRRTLSADMSSKNWLHQNGFPSPFKYSPPSSSSSEEFHRTPGGDREDVWRSIQKNQEPPKMESWDSILSRKKEASVLPSPYVFPLVKRSLSGLSDESLEICTERLGSESGSDCFPSSDCSTECLSEGYLMKEQGSLRGRVVKYKTCPARPLPPPLPSIAGGGDGGGASQLHMQSRRENGRLIVEVVSVSPGNYFEVRKGGGRLVLTLVRGDGGKMASKSEIAEEVFGDMEGVPVVDDSGGDEEVEELVEEKKKSLCSGKISVCKKGLVVKKFVAVGNTNAAAAAWSNKEEIPILQSLPPPPMVARLIPPPPATVATSFNAYEYFWRNKSTVSCGLVNPVITATKNKDSDDNNKNKKSVVWENKNMVIVKGNKGEDLVPYSRGCKVPRRSLLFWEPYCVASS